MSTITSLGFSIFSRYDGTGIRRANRDINQLQRNINNGNSGLNTFTGRMGAMVTAAAALGPSLLPIGAAMTAVAGGLAAAAVSAGAAGGIYGAVTMGAVKHTMELSKKLTVANTGLNTQKATLSKLTPGTAAYTAQLMKVRDAQGKVNAIMAGLGPVQRQFLDNTEKIKGAWQGFITQTSSSTLGPLNTLMTVMIKHMQDLAPLINDVGGLAQEVADKIKRWADNGGLARFIHVLRTDGVSNLALFLGIAQRVLAVLGDGFRAFLPLGHTVTKTILQGAEALKQWADGGGFQRFLAQVQKNGPQIQAFFRNLWAALKNLSTALAGLGPLSLLTASGLLRMVAALPPSWIQAIVIGFVAWRAAEGAALIVTKAMVLWNARQRIGWIATIILMRAARAAILAWSAAQWLLNAAMTANPIGIVIVAVAALVAVIVVIAVKTRWFQNIWRVTWAAIKTAAFAVWHALKAASSSVWAGMQQIWRALHRAYRAVFVTTWRAIMSFGRAVWNAMRTAFSAVWRGIQRVGSSIWHAMSRTATSVFHGMAHTLGSIWHGIVAAAKTAWNKVRSVVRTPIAFVINHVIAPLAKTFNSIAKAVHIGLRVPVPKFARGGHVNGPGTGTSDSVPAMLSAGEYVIPAHVVRQHGVGFFDSLRGGNAPQAVQSMGFQGKGLGSHALGGIIPNPIDVAKKVGKGIGSTIKGGLGLLHKIPGVGKLLDTFGSWSKKFISGTLFKGISALTGAIPGGGLIHDVVKGGAKSLINGAVNLLFNQNNEAGGPIGGNIPKGARLSLLKRALGLTHTPPPGTMAAWLKGLNTLITRESGWNAGAINRTDSNAKAGHPSQGLMQTIPGTFNAYKLPGHNNIRNGLDNVIAGIRYIKARYGNITKVQQANANAAPKGYALGGMVKMVANSFDKGGYLPKGLSLAYNGTGRPEPVGHNLTGGYAVEFNNCTFGGGTTKRDIERWVVEGLTEAERKGRIPRRRG